MNASILDWNGVAKILFNDKAAAVEQSKNE
jgi:hypothetical protein